MKVVATYNIKGGVGKTSTAVNVGYLAARDGLRTLIWDLDPQGSATYLFRVKPKVKGGGKALLEGRRTLDEAIKGTDFDRLDLMPADFSYRNLDLDLDSTKRPTDRLRRLITPLRDDYDLVILDCPPSVSLVSENVVHACDVLLVPLIPAMLSVRTFDQLIDFVDGLPGRKPQVMAFLSMVDLRKKAHREFAEGLPHERASLV
ncbi:MAG: ParA family protein, partial [Blastococcus sp.]